MSKPTIRSVSVAVLLAVAPAAWALTEVPKDGLPMKGKAPQATAATQGAGSAQAPGSGQSAGPAQAPGAAQTQGSGQAAGAPSSVLPTAADYSATMLPELKGVVAWKTLGQVSPVKQGAKIVPEFSKEVLALDSKEGRFHGFMLPLDMGDRQKRFILTAVPPHCSFCLPAGPDAMIEVVAKSPIRFGFDPIVISGKLAVLKDDPTGVLYRVTDAVLVPASQLK